MASILRGFRYPFGYFAGFARSIVFNNNVRPTDMNTLLSQPVQCLCGSFSSSSGLATAVARSNDSLERSIRRLDQDVKRSGRISRRDIEEILDEIRLTQSATSSQSLLVIRCCGNLVPDELPEVRTKLVKEIWKTLNKLNIQMDISHYNALLRVYLENEYNFSPTEFLADLESKGIEPNRVTYQRLIAHYCQRGDIEGATKILEYMREKQLPVNENVFNALIMGHSVAGDMESAADILKVMNQAGLEPSSDTYTTLLSGYAKQGNLAEIEKILETCDKNDIYFLDKDILEVIYHLAVSGHGKSIDSLLNRIRKGAGYNQDAINSILRLINKGEEETAFRILLTMPRGVRSDGELHDTGGFFVKQLVKAGSPTQSIFEICKKLEDQGFNARASLIALEAAVTNGKIDLTCALLKKVHELGGPIRQHFFWPLICSAESQNQVLDVLTLMQKEFNLQPNGETIREYAIPALKEKQYDRIITLLRGAGVSPSTIATSIVYQALLDMNLSEAARLASMYQVYYSPFMYRRPLILALNKTKDLDAYILLVRHIYENIPRLNMINKDQDEEELVADSEEIDADAKALRGNQAEMLGRVVHDACSYFKSNRAEMIHNILNGLVNQGLTISNNQAARIQEKLGAELTPEISTMLGKLSTGELEPVPIDRSERPRMSLNDMESSQIENMITSLDAKGDNTKGLKRQLLAACIREKNVQKLQSVIEKLQSEGFVITAGVFAQIADMYAGNDDLENAIGTIKKIKEKEPDFLLDRIKTVRIAQLFMNQDRTEDAVKFLEAHKHAELEPNDFTVNYNATLWRLLNSIAEKGKPQELKKIFDTLVSFKYCEPNNVLLGPLIKVHLVNDDLGSAINAFEEVCQQYRTTPWKNELACRLIQKEDATNLQKLTDLSTDIHGEVNSLYDLVFSFVECGRIRQARKILETPGLRTRPQRINYACERYRQEGMVQPLEGLIEATKDMNHIDRMDIYYNLLLSYVKEAQPDKALGLWTKLQEENITPSDPFLISLANFLRQNNIEVPFVVPESTKAMNVQMAKKEKSGSQPLKQVARYQESMISAPIQEYRKAIRSKDINYALSLRQKLPLNEKLSVSDKSNLVEGLVKVDRLNEAKKIIKEMLENEGTFPTPRIFRFYMNKVAHAGDVATLEEIGQKLSPELKRMVSYDNRYCHANVVSGQAEKYITTLENELSLAKTDEQIKQLAEKFPRGGAIAILEAHPELADRFKSLADKFAEKKIFSPMNVLWMHYFISNDSNAETIFQKYLTEEPRLMFQKIMQESREKQNEELIQRLIQKLQNSKISEGAMGNAYSCLMDVFSAKEKYDEGLKIVNDVNQSIGLEYINRTALLRVKEGLEKQGKSFSFKIPEKSNNNQEGPDTSSSSSASSSDDEVTSKSNPK